MAVLSNGKECPSYLLECDYPSKSKGKTFHNAAAFWLTGPKPAATLTFETSAGSACCLEPRRSRTRTTDGEGVLSAVARRLVRIRLDVVGLG